MQTNKGVWLATMETEHYIWRAIGNSPDEAIDTIVFEWQYGKGWSQRENMSKEELMECYGINYEFLEFGKCVWY